MKQLQGIRVPIEAHHWCRKIYRMKDDFFKVAFRYIALE